LTDHGKTGSGRTLSAQIRCRALSRPVMAVLGKRLLLPSSSPSHFLLLTAITTIGLVPRQCGAGLELHQIYDTPQTSSPDQAATQPSPEFVMGHSGNVTAILGKTGLLNCRVEGVGNRTVSWIRHKDTHLLTAGRYTYTSDMRFRAIHKLLSQDYLLQILPVRAADRGLYECQISTTPVMSHHVFLTVAEPVTEILGGPTIYLEEGFTMNLTCLVRGSPEPPQYIFWYHNDQPISYSSARGGVSQITEKGSVTASFLLIQEARLVDSGSYACHASVGNTSWVSVHVIRSQKPEQLVPSASETTNSAVICKGEPVALLLVLLGISL